MSRLRTRHSVEISVVIPTFNRAQTLGRALKSVLTQDEPADELIVVDDGSTDETAVLLAQEYPQVRVIRQENQGVSAARNTGIGAAAHPWLAFLDSDDEWLPSKLAVQRRALAEHPELRFCHADEIWIRNGKRVNPMKKHAKQGGWIYDQCLALCCISPSAVVMHRSIFEEVGLFDASLPAAEDYDLWLRLCARYEVLFVSEKLLTRYGGHQDQLSQKYWGMDRFRVVALSKMLRSSQLPETQRCATVEMLCRKLRVLNNGARKRENCELASECRKMAAEFGISLA